MLGRQGPLGWQLEQTESSFPTVLVKPRVELDVSIKTRLMAPWSACHANNFCIYSFNTDWNLDQPNPSKLLSRTGKLLAATVVPSARWKTIGFQVLDLNGNTSCCLSNQC